MAYLGWEGALQHYYYGMLCQQLCLADACPFAAAAT